MRAVRYHRYGDPDVLVLEDAPEPHAVPGAVRIRTQAASVNPIDLQIRAGLLRGAVEIELPVVPGRDAVGIVDEIGAGVVGVVEGDLVFGLGGLQDTTAEYAVLTAWSEPAPTWSTAHAAAAGLACATALGALEALGRLEGRTLLVEGGSGAVGSACIVFAVDRGATVIASGHPGNHAYVERLGAIPVEYGRGLSDRVSRAAGRRVDAAVEAAGAGTLEDLVAIVGDPTRVATVTDPAGAERLGARLVWARNDSSLLREAARLGSRGAYLPRIAETFDAARAAHAHRLAEQTRSGKVVVELSP